MIATSVLSGFFNNKSEVIAMNKKSLIILSFVLFLIILPVTVWCSECTNIPYDQSTISSEFFCGAPFCDFYNKENCDIYLEIGFWLRQIIIPSIQLAIGQDICLWAAFGIFIDVVFWIPSECCCYCGAYPPPGWSCDDWVSDLFFNLFLFYNQCS